MAKNVVVLNGIRTRFSIPRREQFEAFESHSLIDGEDFGFASVWRRVYSPDYKGELKNHPRDKGGKWLIFLSNTREAFLKHWPVVKVGVLEGHLGIAAKILKPGGRSKSTLVICVYTKDCSNTEDVMSVRESLRALGYGKTLPYKPNYETLAGRYGSDTVLYRA